MTDQPPRTPSPQRDDLDDARTYAIIGAAIDVHRILGNGFLERVYHLALGTEFRRRGILFESEPAVPVWYKGERLDCLYRPDYLCFDSIVVELKVVPGVTQVETSQVLNYLKATRCSLGLLLNFGTPLLEKRRFVMDHAPEPSVVSVSSVAGQAA